MDSLPQQPVNEQIPEDPALIHNQNKKPGLKKFIIPITILVFIISAFGMLLKSFYFTEKTDDTLNMIRISVIPSVTPSPTIDSTYVIQVKGVAMEPAIKNGEYFRFDRNFYTLHPVQRGDIVHLVRTMPDGKKTEYVKRIAGLPGEPVKIAGGKLYISDTPLNEDYLVSPEVQTSLYQGSFFQEGIAKTVPPEHYFVLGDNRKYSSDSREWGFVSKEDVVGKLLARVENYIPPTYSPEEINVHTKSELIPSVANGVELLRNMNGFCSPLPSFQNPELICVLNNEERCDIQNMSFEQLQRIYTLAETAINDCIRYQSEVKSGKSK